MRSIATMPEHLREQVWEIASRVEWDAADWEIFYRNLTKAFVIIAAKHARAKIGAEAGATPGKQEVR